jgi:hypothetical protein
MPKRVTLMSWPHKITPVRASAVSSQDMREFIAYAAKANPGKLNLGSAGAGTPPQLFKGDARRLARTGSVSRRSADRRRLLGGQVMFDERRALYGAGD